MIWFNFDMMWPMLASRSIAKPSPSVNMETPLSAMAPCNTETSKPVSNQFVTGNEGFAIFTWLRYLMYCTMLSKLFSPLPTSPVKVNGAGIFSALG